MLGVKNFKWLIVFITALFVISTSIHPVAYAGGLKFGIISVVKDKIEELKQKKKEKEEKEKVKSYESTTDTDGVANFTLDSGETASVKVINQSMGDPLSGIKVFLITDGDVGAYLLADPEGNYIPKIVNASIHETQGQGTYRAKGIPWGNLAEIGLEFWGEMTGVRPHPLYSEEIPEYIYNVMLSKFFVSYKSIRLKDIPPTLQDYANMVIEPVLGAGAVAAICSVVPGIGTIVGGLAAGIVLAAIKISEEAWSAWWYIYYKDILGYSDDDWFDIYRPSSKWLTLIGQAFVILYPRASVPPCEATNSIGGVTTEYATGKHLAGVEVILDPRPYSGKATVNTGLTGTYLFKEVRDPAFYGTKSFYTVTAKKKGYYNGYIYGVEPGTVDANISLAPRITSKNPPKTPSPPSGPSTGTIGISYSFSTSAADPDGDKVQYRFDWGDGNISEYTSLVNSGSSASQVHFYSSSGTYYIMVQARDSNGATSGWSGSHSITIEQIAPSQPPNMPNLPSGPSTGSTGTSYSFSTSATDPDGDQVQYRFDWDDGNISGYTSLVNSGSSASKSHSYSSSGTYHIMAQARDSDGVTSGWSGSHSITISGGARDEGTMKWEFQTGANVDSSPAISSDGTIYVGSVDHKLYAINSDGTKKWEFETDDEIRWSSPAISSDGTIYVGSAEGWLGPQDSKLYAINSDGTKKWEFETRHWVDSSPAIGSDGTIYVGSVDKKLYAINSDGTKKWEFLTGSYVFSSPAIGSDGTIYVGSRDNKLYAINPDGTKKWEFPTGGWVQSSPAIGSDGTIYVGSHDYKLYAINPDGIKKWEFQTGGNVDSSPAIGSDGTIYVGSADYKLYAINPDGTKKWEFETGGSIYYSSPAIGSDGIIYIGSNDNKLYAINSNGTKKWEFPTGGWVRCSSPAIGSDGTIYVGSRDNKLYAIYGSGSLANTPWPMFHHNLKHTGRQ